MYIIRRWDSSRYEIISEAERLAAECRAGKNSAFATSRRIIGGFVEGTLQTVEEFLEIHNS